MFCFAYIFLYSFVLISEFFVLFYFIQKNNLASTLISLVTTTQAPRVSIFYYIAYKVILLHLKTLRYRDIALYAQGHTARTWWDWDFVLVCLNLKLMFAKWKQISWSHLGEQTPNLFIFLINLLAAYHLPIESNLI